MRSGSLRPRGSDGFNIFRLLNAITEFYRVREESMTEGCVRGCVWFHRLMPRGICRHNV